MLEKVEHGHHVFRACGQSAVLRMYEKFAMFLRLEALSNNLIPSCNQRARKALWPKEGFCESSESQLRRPPASDFALN
jgi:hypothetical protein